MGMTSTFMTEELKIVKLIPIDIKTELENENIDFSEGVSFQNWNDYKIEGYWYQNTVDILKKIAEFIEGYVEFLYEEGYKFRIVFKNGKVFYQKCHEVWDKSEELKGD